MGQFIGDRSAIGFYGLEVDELQGVAVIFYRIGEKPYMAQVDMKVRGNQLLLKYKKNRKTLIRETVKDDSGEMREIVYPMECPPAKGGWRRGASFGRRLIRTGDEMARRLLVGEAHIEFQNKMTLCADGDCGVEGCEDWNSTVSSKAASMGLVASTAAAVERAPFSKVLLEAKMSERDVLTQYQSEIDTILPPQLYNLTVLSTSYQTTPLPYPDYSDTSNTQRLTIGVVSKRYAATAQSEAFTVQLEPLLVEFQAPASNKCGSWISASNKSFFDVRGRPAMYTQPEPGGTVTTASLAVCGQSYTVLITGPASRSRDEYSTLFNSLPLDDIERLVGVKTK